MKQNIAQQQYKTNNFIQMNTKKIEKTFINLSGELEKLSTSVFVGFQIKFFSILQKGQKIGYRNLTDQNFAQKNIFFIKQVTVCEAQEQFTFTLQTPRRTYTLKAKDQQTKVKWMRALTKMRKQIIRKKFVGNHTMKSMTKIKYIPSSTQHTLLPNSLTLLNQTHRSIQSSSFLHSTQRSIRLSSAITPNPQKDEHIKKDFMELLKNVPQQYVKFNTYIVSLKSKVENLFTASFVNSTYILFSSKSLYPNEHILEDNLTNMMLPPWAQVNKIYRITPKNMPKLHIELASIIDLQQDQDKTLLKVRTQDNVHSFYCQTFQQKQRFKQVLTTARQNLQQVLINNKMTRKNYDKLVYLFNNQYDEFLLLLKQVVCKYIPNNHHYEPQVVIKLIDVLIPFMQQFILILKSKKQNCTQIIHQLLKQVHDEVKLHIKLTWDTSYVNMKGEHILKFLNALAAYHSLIKDFVTDLEFMTGMKQLSKIYVRQSWKNFQDIILGIVEQEKTLNFYQDQDHQYIQTNSTIDLFKFIYQVYDLAAPCWEHKLHLHNVQKLMCRAISVFINELKAAVDQTIIANKQLIAVSNNYFRFCLTIDQFYQEKFSSLQEKTKQSYEKLKADYKQLSSIILDKLVFDLRASIKKYLNSCSFYNIRIQKVYQIILSCCQNLQVDLLHTLLQKRFYQKIFLTIRQCVLKCLEKQICSKKKQNISKIIDQLDNYSFDLLDISALLYKGKPKIDKELNEVNILLSSQNHNQILTLIKATNQDIKQAYMNIIMLREDYYVGGPLYYALNEDNIDGNSVAHRSSNFDQKNANFDGRSTNKPTVLTAGMNRQMRASFSAYYIENDFDSQSMYSKNDDDSFQNPLRLISQGYLMKCKTNKKVWQNLYFRLKNGVLYFYQNQKSEKSQNSITVSQMTKVFYQSAQNLSFIIMYKALNRQKQIQFKCENYQLRDRWIQSLSLQIKRIRNDQKVKKHKFKVAEKKKNNLIIDYQQLMEGKGFFSYTTGV